MRSPQCFFSEPLACFVGLSKEMHITAHPIEVVIIIFKNFIVIIIFIIIIFIIIIIIILR